MTEHLPPSLADIEELARSALDTIPRELKAHVGPVVIRVEEFPDEETEEAMGLDSPFDILGLISGRNSRNRIAAGHDIGKTEPAFNVGILQVGRSATAQQLDSHQLEWLSSLRVADVSFERYNLHQHCENREVCNHVS